MNQILTDVKVVNQINMGMRDLLDLLENLTVHEEQAFTPSSPEEKVLADMASRIDERDFMRWVEEGNSDPDDLADPATKLYEIGYYLQSEWSIQVSSEGVTRFWKLQPRVAKIIGDNPVELYHYTSSVALPSIQAHGLTGDNKSVNRTQTAGVFLTTETSGPAVDGYARNAVNAVRGKARDTAYGVRLTVKMYLHELEADPDDADIQSGEVQFMTDHVPSDRIVDIDRV